MIRGPFAILLQILAEGGSPRGHPSASNTPKPAHPLLPCRRRPLARLVVTVFASVVVRQETHAFLPTGELKSANSGKTMHVSRVRETPSSAQPKSIEIVATARQSYLNAIQYEYCICLRPKSKCIPGLLHQFLQAPLSFLARMYEV